MNFARVFTGFDEQAERANIEHVEGKSNMIDPMQMKAEWHDAYPKPKLDGTLVKICLEIFLLIFRQLTLTDGLMFGIMPG